MRLLYVDTSALFKRYVEEDESEAVVERMQGAPTVGTVLVTRVEVAAALAKAVRDQRLSQREATEAEQDFLDDGQDFTRIGLTDALIARAGTLAWQYNLRGYDATQLAAALAWQDHIEGADDDAVFACFDNELSEAATAERLETWPR